MLIYLHGLNSGSASHKAQMLHRAMAERGIGEHFGCPALPYEPVRAIETIETALAGRTGPTTLVGSSLGGFYAAHLAEKYDLRAVLLNPAVRAQHDLEAHIGPQRNLYTGQSYELTRAHLEQLRTLDVQLVNPRRYLLIVETGDEVLDYRLALEKFCGCEQIVISGGDHSLRSFPDHIPAILRFAGLAAA